MKMVYFPSKLYCDKTCDTAFQLWFADSCGTVLVTIETRAHVLYTYIIKFASKIHDIYFLDVSAKIADTV
jgi:hypothetical protein